MDLFAGIDGLGPAPTKKVSLAEQRKLRESQDRQVVDAFESLDLLSKPGTSSSSASTSAIPPLSSNASSKRPEEDDIFGLFSSAPAIDRQQTLQPKPKPASNIHERSEPQPRSEEPSRVLPRSQRKQLNSTREQLDAFRDETPQRPSRPRAAASGAVATNNDDREIAQLVEMGFEPNDAQRALTAMNGSVRGAVNWLMAEAQGLPLPEPRRSGLSSSLGSTDFSDFQNAASQIGASMFSKASSLFAKGRKEIEKAYNSYNNQYAGDSSQPAWLRDKPKYDARGGVSLDPELPQRPARGERLASRRLNEERQRQPDEETTEHCQASSNDQGFRTARDKPSRAEVFRQRQRERTAGSNARSVTQENNNEILIEADAPPPQNSNSFAPGPKSSVEAAFTPDTTPEIDLLNLSGPDTASAAGSLTATQQDLYVTSKELGTDSYRKGDYERAIEHYSAALQVIPEASALRALLLSNRSAAYLKAGNLRGAFEDTSAGIAMLPARGEGIVLPDKGADMHDIWVKLVTRNAQAAENMEKFEAALKSWQLLLDNGHATAPILDAKRRCLKALNPDLVAKQEKASSTTVKKSQRRGWGTTGATPSSAEGKAALNKVRANHEKQADEERQKDQLRDRVTARVDNWRRGNENNLRALLSTLQNVLWDSSGWNSVSLSDLVITKKVRQTYMKAVAKTHPDKVPSSAPVEVKMISQSVFVAIQSAWEVFRQENNL